jgi:hypothetical protein
MVVRHVPTQRQLNALVAILKQGEKPIITAVANGKLVITPRSAVAAEQSNTPSDDHRNVTILRVGPENQKRSRPRLSHLHGFTNALNARICTQMETEFL